MSLSQVMEVQLKKEWNLLRSIDIAKIISRKITMGAGLNIKKLKTNPKNTSIL